MIETLGRLIGWLLIAAGAVMLIAGFAGMLTAVYCGWLDGRELRKRLDEYRERR